jgi:hypothetical protein
MWVLIRSYILRSQITHLDDLHQIHRDDILRDLDVEQPALDGVPQRAHVAVLKRERTRENK